MLQWHKKSKKPLVDTGEMFHSPVKRILYSIMLKPGLERVLGIDRINSLYDSIAQTTPDAAVFVENAFKHLGIKYEIDAEDIERLRAVKGPLVIVCNHPYGGLEALFLLLIMSKIRDDYRIMANFMLGRIKEVKDKMIFVDPFNNADSAQRNLAPLKESIQFLKSGGMLGVFPAGEVASLDIKSGKIKEPEWNPAIAKIIKMTGASVAPIYFHGHNSVLFQMAGVIHERLRTSLLARELVMPNTTKIRYRIGNVITPEKVKQFTDVQELTNYLYSKTYLLGTGYMKQRPSLNPGKLIRRLKPHRDADKIIAQIPANIVLDEVKALESKKLHTQNQFSVYCFKSIDAPATVMEIGRLREITFRAIGEGSGKSADIDEFDQYYYHLMVWNNAANEIVGAYRLMPCDEALKLHGKKGLYINTLFEIETELYNKIQPAIEMGRSFVRMEYQKNIWSLFLLWVGISKFISSRPRYRYLIGPVSISNAFHNVSRSFLVNFLSSKYLDKSLAPMVHPKHPFTGSKNYDPNFYKNFPLNNLNDVQDVINDVEDNDLRIPILLKHYLKMGGRILAFNVDPDFADALDALMLTDMLTADPANLRKYMGDEEYDSYIAFHSGGNS